MKKILCFLLLSYSGYSQNTLNKTIFDLNSFWNAKFEQKNLQFLEPSIKYYSAKRPFVTSCGVMAEKNAIFCGLDNSISISTDLFKDFYKAGQSLTFFYGIIAHEYGHAVQRQLNIINTYTIENELQADCLAGVYFNSALEENKVSINDALQLHFLYKKISDKGNIDIYEKGIHGTFEMRINAFKTGFEKGSVNSCISGFTFAKN